MTKDYALAGVRLGYALAHESIINMLAKVQAPWNVNAFAQAAGLAALSDAPYLSATLRALRTAKQELVTQVATLGLTVMPSAVHYFLMEVGDAKSLRAKLLAHDINVRDCSSFGLSQFVRMATQRPAHNARLLNALHEIRR